jgi:hypothetical protein
VGALGHAVPFNVPTTNNFKRNKETGKKNGWGTEIALVHFVSLICSLSSSVSKIRQHTDDITILYGHIDCGCAGCATEERGDLPASLPFFDPLTSSVWLPVWEGKCTTNAAREGRVREGGREVYESGRGEKNEPAGQKSNIKTTGQICVTLLLKGHRIKRNDGRTNPLPTSKIVDPSSSLHSWRPHEWVGHAGSRGITCFCYRNSKGRVRSRLHRQVFIGRTGRCTTTVGF